MKFILYHAPDRAKGLLQGLYDNSKRGQNSGGRKQVQKKCLDNKGILSPRAPLQ